MISPPLVGFHGQYADHDKQKAEDKGLPLSLVPSQRLAIASRYFPVPNNLTGMNGGRSKNINLHLCTPVELSENCN